MTDRSCCQWTPIAWIDGRMWFDAFDACDAIGIPNGFDALDGLGDIDDRLWRVVSGRDLVCSDGVRSLAEANYAAQAAAAESAKNGGVDKQE